jgi:hypothetical protein
MKYKLTRETDLVVSLYNVPNVMAQSITPAP